MNIMGKTIQTSDNRGQGEVNNNRYCPNDGRNYYHSLKMRNVRREQNAVISIHGAEVATGA